MSNFLSIYIHIPFCKRKCNYCNFVSFCDIKNKKNKYLKILNKELNNKLKINKNKIIKSIFFGGGTPSLLNISEIKKILNIIKKNNKLINNCEITIEANPKTVTENKLNKYLEMGINRISFGVQSFNDNELKILGRIHTSRDAIKSIDLAKKVGFENINLDILLGIPEQSESSLLNTLKTIQILDVTHVSSYMLILEKHTNLYHMVQTGQVTLPSDEETISMYQMTTKYLNNIGYQKYEISNFAKKDFECQHNLTYWQGGDYLGVGVAAHSYINGIRIANSNDFNKYLLGKNIKNEKLSNVQKYEEYVMLGLRTKYGIDTNFIKEKFDVNLKETKNSLLSLLKNNNLISINDNLITLTENGINVSNEIIAKILE